MGKVNKITGGVFAEIVGEDGNAYDIFMSGDNNSELNPFLDKYREIITRNKTEFEKMSRLEEIIMQIRAKQNLNDIKLSLVREYIYARAPFFRRDKMAKDIRVIVDNVECWSNDMESLSKNSEFMGKAKKKLIKVMEKEIGENMSVYLALYK